MAQGEVFERPAPDVIVVQRLQRENDSLKQELARARSQLASRARPNVPEFGPDSRVVETNGPAYSPYDTSPVGSPESDAGLETAPALPPPTRPEVAAVSQQPTPTSAPMRPTPTPTAGLRRHVIAKGDTLFSLAQRYYGNRSRWRDIFEANRDLLRSKDDPLKIGMELKIPQ